MKDKLAFAGEMPLKRKTSESSWDDDNPAAWPTVATIRAHPELDEPNVVDTGNGKVYTQSGRLWVYRNTDIRDGDRVVLPEGSFGVVSNPQDDRLHPMNGHDFEVMWVALERGG